MPKGSSSTRLLQQRIDEREKNKGAAGQVGNPDSENGVGENAEGENGAGSENSDADTDVEEAAEEFIPSTAKLLQACLTGQCDDIPVDMTDGLKQQLDVWRGETETNLPENLNATLRPYQMRGDVQESADGLRLHLGR